MELSQEELATILCALRQRQEAGYSHCCCAPECDHFEEFDPLTDAQIDALCTRLNTARQSDKGVIQP